MRVEVEGFPIDLLTRSELFQTVTGWIGSSGRPRQIVTLNTTIFMRALRNDDLSRVIETADLIMMESVGIERLLRKRGYSNGERWAGVELIKALLDWGSSRHLSVYCYGGTVRTAVSLQKMLESRYPGIAATVRSGYSKDCPITTALSEIERIRPNLVLAGLGTPMQELFVAKLCRSDLHQTVGIGVGGTLNIIAGCQREAPARWRTNGWEWLYRLCQDPRRIDRIPDLVRFYCRYLGKSHEG